MNRRLLDRGLRVFLDKIEMEEGHKISFQIEHTICVVSIHLAIFSPGYAQSSWCLDKLFLVIKSEATILPIFFNVDPSMVRYTLKGEAYVEALLNLQEKRTFDPQTSEENPRYGSDTIQNWRTALSCVADLSNFKLKYFNGSFDHPGRGMLLHKTLLLSFDTVL
jgi:hypothetical protein